MVDLTVVILTKNEEKNLKKCIDSFHGIAKRFVLIDSYSTDSTLDVAASLGADVYQHPFTTHAAQKNWGIENAEINTEWVMSIDADEELTPELAAEIDEKLPQLDESITGIELKRRLYFMGRWIKHGGKYPEIHLRIFRKEKAEFEHAIMDEHMVLKEGSRIRFKHDFIDNNTKTLEWWIGKHNWYSDLEVNDYKNKKLALIGSVPLSPVVGDKTSYYTEQIDQREYVEPKLFGTNTERKKWLKYIVYYKTPLMVRAHWYFIYRYYFKLGFLDGKQGLIFHFLQGYWYRFLVDAKLFEMEQTGVVYKNLEDLKQMKK
ncbi:glycosyltransferase family 2 protein [Priestia megaterium]|uniref:Glycosyltransferase family 2 protein n=1 Tax=Priestia megaterium TaxID=1404 RepID=A0A6H1NWK2_PRIMG|nr:glycosyltransferase family 2 protein [Priestia megaterium]QIZ05648.1 glycosyltransferase family 2 protein [Priestia megaterium]